MTKLKLSFTTPKTKKATQVESTDLLSLDYGITLPLSFHRYPINKPPELWILLAFTRDYGRLNLIHRPTGIRRSIKYQDDSFKLGVGINISDTIDLLVGVQYVGFFDDSIGVDGSFYTHAMVGFVGFKFAL